MEKAPSADCPAVDPAQMIEKYQAGIWRYLRALGCDASLADDLTQDTFVNVLRKPFEQYNEVATGAYLRRVAHNLYVSHHRRQGKVIAVEDMSHFESYWVEWMSDDSGEDLILALKACLEGITKRARWALEMRFRQRLPRKDIAEQLQITEHGAKNLMQRAKKQLRACIEGKINA